MNRFIRGVAQAVVETFPLPEPIVEIGAYQVPGQHALADLRPLFPNKNYIGLDMRPGPGVDCIGDVEALPQDDGSIGTVIALNTFEHVRRFWRGFAEVYRVLSRTGVLIVSCPFHVRIHNVPSDYWRFTPEAFQVLLEDYPQRIVGWHGPEANPENVWAVAFREDYPQITEAQFEKYRTLVGQYARQPMSWRRKLRYQIFNWIDGRGVCTHLLEQERWQTVQK